MDKSIKTYINRGSKKEWAPLVESGVNTAGLFVKPLRYDETNQRPLTFLLKFEPGATYPYHNHPAGEELLILEGSCIIEGEMLRAGDYLYTPPGFKHSVKSEEGCKLFFMVPEEVEIIE